MNRHGELVDRRRHRAASASATASSTARSCSVKDGAEGRSRARSLAEWDPFAMPILTEVGGVVKFGDIVEGVTMTGAARRGHRPLAQGRHRVARTRTRARASSIKDDDGRDAEAARTRRATARYLLPGRREHRRRTTATRSTPATSSRRSRARPRRPRTSPAVCRASPSSSRRASRRTTRSSREIDGVVSFGKDTKGKRKVVITPEVDGEPRRSARST